MDDSQLLRQFIATRSPEAFSALVRVYADLVYSAAERQMSQKDVAEDVTQAVFILLARRAGSITSAPLAGWLLRTTHFACRDAKKLIARRQFHERRAAEMKTEEIPPSQDPMWESYAPLLDEALAGLRQKDRDAVALRFFRGLNLRDVGTTLGISEEAARKRVDRGVARLRLAMTSKVTVPVVAVLATQLAARASKATPTHLVQSITATATTATAKGIFIGAVAQKVSHAMTLMKKIKVALMIIAAIGVAGAGTGTLVMLAVEHETPTTKAAADSPPTPAPTAKNKPWAMQGPGIYATDRMAYEEAKSNWPPKPSIATYNIDDLLHLAILPNGLLQVDTQGLMDVRGSMKIDVTGGDPSVAKAIWLIQAQNFNNPPGFGPNFHVDRMDFDQKEQGQIWYVAFSTNNGMSNISAHGFGIDVEFNQHDGELEQGRKFVSLEVNASDGEGKSTFNFSAVANSLMDLQNQHPEEVREYLQPILMRMAGHDLLTPGAADYYIAFPQIPADPQVTQVVKDILPRLNAESFEQRQAASADLIKLGRPGVLAVLRLDTTVLSQEQKSRCNTFTKMYCVSIENPTEALHDIHFLLAALTDEDLAVRQAGKHQLETLLGHTINYDIAASVEVRAQAIDALHKAVAKELSRGKSPATSPSHASSN